MINAAIDRYHSLVEQAAFTPQDYQAFHARMREARIMFGDRVQVEYLRAQFISPEQQALVRHAVETIWAALDKLSPHIPTTPRLLDDLGLTDKELELVAIDPGYPGFSTMARFDSFLIGDHLQFVELNAECPAGPAYAEVMAQTFRALPTMQQFETEYEVQGFHTRQRLLDTLLATYRAWGGEGAPQIAIVDYLDIPTVHEFYMVKEYFESQGAKALVEDPRKLRYENGRLLSSDGVPIDLVYRRVLTNEFIERWDEVQPLFLAYRDHKVCMVNNFRSKYLHKKMIFGLLTDGQNQQWFTPEEQQLIAKHIPWTRRMREGTTDYFGEQIDLVSWAKAHPEKLVLKPNDDYGGKGITVGWTVTPEEWAIEVDRACGDDYVLQEKVKVASADFPIVGDGLRFDTMNVDLDPFVFRGEVEGFLTRLSGTALCNVTSGGGIVPTYIVAPRAQ